MTGSHAAIIILCVLATALVGLASVCCEGQKSERTAEPTHQEFKLSDGTRCVAIGDRALVCDFQRQGY